MNLGSRAVDFRPPPPHLDIAQLVLIKAVWRIGFRVTPLLVAGTPGIDLEKYERYTLTSTNDIPKKCSRVEWQLLLWSGQKDGQVDSKVRIL